jgi:acetyltransferase-like isoleucine patch superfamily enzyme
VIKYLLVPFRVLSDVIKLFVIYMPGGLGFRLRYFYYKSRFKRIGKNVRIDVGVHIDGAELVSVGSNVHIDKYCVIATGRNLIGKIYKENNPDYLGRPGEISIGDDVHIAQFCILMGYGGISIGNKCVTSAGCKVYSLTNTSNDPSEPEKLISIQPYNQAPFLLGPVVLNENVWLGLNAIVMPSVSIGKDSFCISNSLIFKSFSENSVLAGQPAVLLRRRFKYCD